MSSTLAHFKTCIRNLRALQSLVVRMCIRHLNRSRTLQLVFYLMATSFKRALWCHLGDLLSHVSELSVHVFISSFAEPAGESKTDSDFTKPVQKKESKHCIASLHNLGMHMYVFWELQHSELVVDSTMLA